MIDKLLIETQKVSVCLNERKIIMTANELRKAMQQTASAKAEEYSKRLAGLDKDAKTELKALKISWNIADICGRFTSFFSGQDYYYSKREKVVSTLFSSGSFEDFGGYMRAYQMMSKEQRELFLVYAYSVMSVRHSFIDNRTAPKKNEATEKEVIAEFEAGIIKGVAGEIVDEWAKLWDRHGFAPEKAGEI